MCSLKNNVKAYRIFYYIKTHSLRALKYLLFLIFSAFLINSCEKKDDSVIDPTLYFPQILNAFISPDTNFTAPINEIIVAVVTSQEPVKNVMATLSDPDNNQVRVYELKDNGVSPDTTAGDSHFTAQINETQNCRIAGYYNVEFVAENESGLKSNTIIQSFYVKQVNNQPPLISDLIMPDSLQRPGSGVNLAFMQIKAIDPNGQCDVKVSYFISRRPDGTLGNQGNPIYLYDDGDIPLHGDTTAGDTKYSVIIKIEPTNQLGYYLFTYNAKDRSDSLSNTLKDSVYVYP